METQLLMVSSRKQRNEILQTKRFAGIMCGFGRKEINNVFVLLPRYDEPKENNTIPISIDEYNELNHDEGLNTLLKDELGLSNYDTKLAL